jgi:CRISPR system Cascade subunit CasA
MTIAPELQFSLLTDPLIRYRRASDGQTASASLPQLFVALAADEVRDYPALRPHQRHPWHAFLVQLAAIALHKTERTAFFETAQEWRDALLALTPDDTDGAAWCLVSPPGRAAFLQAATPNWDARDWGTIFDAADELDILLTSKNHDIKGARMHDSLPEDWLFALTSLQTQEGSNSGSHKGISRMNSGAGSRSGVGVAPKGNVGARWKRDVHLLGKEHSEVAEKYGLEETAGLALVWLTPWDGVTSIPFSALDPHYIEICRRVRLFEKSGRLYARRAKTQVLRIDGGNRKGVTGDPWMPVDISEIDPKALSLQRAGFDYKLICDVLFSGKFFKPELLNVHATDGDEICLIAQGIARGNSKTEGYHERRVPISPKVRGLLITNQRVQLERITTQRIFAIDEVIQLLKNALIHLFENGSVQDYRQARRAHKSKIDKIYGALEAVEDARFFVDLNDEMEAADPAAQRLQWLLGLVNRAVAILTAAFDEGPRSGMQKYRAQSAALSRFHGGLRSDKFPIPDLVNYYRQQTIKRQEETSEYY